MLNPTQIPYPQSYISNKLNSERQITSKILTSIDTGLSTVLAGVSNTVITLVNSITAYSEMSCAKLNKHVFVPINHISSTLYKVGSNAYFFMTETKAQQDPIEKVVLDIDTESVHADVNTVMQKLRDNILKDEKLCSKLRGKKGRDSTVYAPVQSCVQDMYKLLKGWNPSSWNLIDTCGFMLDISILLTKDKEISASIFKKGDFFIDKMMGESKSFAKARDKDVNESEWAREFTPKGTKAQSGVSSTTSKLLYVLDKIEAITPEQIESVMNGICAYWKNSVMKRVTGQYHTTAEVWASYNRFLLQKIDDKRRDLMI